MTNREKYFSKVDGKMLVDLIDCDNCDDLGIVCRSKCPFVDEKMCDKWLDEEAEQLKEQKNEKA